MLFLNYYITLFSSIFNNDVDDMMLDKKDAPKGIILGINDRK